MRFLPAKFALCTSLPLFLFSLAGCASLLGGKAEIRDRRKFIIEARPLHLALEGSQRPYPFRVQIKKFSVSRLYNRDQIVFRLSPIEIKEDRWNIWAVRPSEMLTDVVEDYLKGVNLFSNIRQEFLDSHPDYIFSGTIKAIERFDSGDLWFAHLSISMQLIDQRTKEIFWSRPFDLEQQVFNADMSHTIEALTSMVHSTMEEAIDEIDFRFLNLMHQQEAQPLEQRPQRRASALLPEDLAGQPNREGVAARDTTRREPDSHPDYELIPGKIAPLEK